MPWAMQWAVIWHRSIGLVKKTHVANAGEESAVRARDFFAARRERERAAERFAVWSERRALGVPDKESGPATARDQVVDTWKIDGFG